MDPISAIGSNPAASQTAQVLAQTFIQLQKTLARISSGNRINSPEVDPAGLSQLEKLNSQIDQINAGSSNATNAVSFTDVQSGAVQQLASIENRKGELAIRAQDATLTDSDRQALQAEFSNLQNTQSSILGQKFNDVPLFSSSSMQVVTDGGGSTSTLNAVNLGAVGASGGIGDSVAGGTNVSTASSAASALDTIKTALNNISSGFAQIGAGQSQLNITRETNSVQVENLTASASRIGGADIAQESANLSRLDTIMQTGIFGLSRANASRRSLLNLLA